jgi:hypothetical protein
MKIETQTSIARINNRNTATHLVVIALAPQEGRPYEYCGLRPTGIQLGWLRKNRRWELGIAVLVGDSVLKSGKLGKRRDVVFNIFRGRWAADHLDQLPVSWRQLISEHTPGRPAPGAGRRPTSPPPPSGGPRPA